MTDTRAPDRIWINLRDDRGDWTSEESDKRPDEAMLLLSTPAREHAEELVVALEEMTRQASSFQPTVGRNGHNDKMIKSARTLLAKINGENQ